MRAIRNSSLQSVNRYIVTSLHRYIGGGFTILDFRITISSVIYTIHLPSSLGLMRANEFSILELHIPFGARPGFFAPPISRKKIRPTLLDDFSHVFVNKGRDIVADVEDEPDRNEARNAVKINLYEIANDVSIQEPHRKNFKFQASIATEFSPINL